MCVDVPGWSRVTVGQGFWMCGLATSSTKASGQHLMTRHTLRQHGPSIGSFRPVSGHCFWQVPRCLLQKAVWTAFSAPAPGEIRSLQAHEQITGCPLGTVDRLWSPMAVTDDGNPT